MQGKQPFEKGTRNHPTSRDGYVYLAVLLTALIVSTAVVASLSISSSTVRAQVDRVNRMAAIRLAESEIQRQASRLSSDPNWRDQHVNGDLSTWVDVTGMAVATTDEAVVRYQLSDPDGDLADDATDAVYLMAHARVGDSQAAILVQLQPAYRGLDLLSYGVTVMDDCEVELGSAMVCESPIQVAGSCQTTSSGTIVAPRLECSGGVTPALRAELVSADVIGPTHDVVDIYVQSGTEIPLTALPLQGGVRTISQVVLTAADNPYGSADAKGIYWIDAAGGSVRITNARLGCTLAIRNALSVELSGAIVWEYPADPEIILATDAPVVFELIEPVLDEAMLASNFNPASSPFRGTLSNATTVDQYDTHFRGVVYTSDDVLVQATGDGSPIQFTGALISEELLLYNGINVFSLPELASSAPLGLIDPVPMRFINGTFRRVPTP